MDLPLICDGIHDFVSIYSICFKDYKDADFIIDLASGIQTPNFINMFGKDIAYNTNTKDEITEELEFFLNLKLAITLWDKLI